MRVFSYKEECLGIYAEVKRGPGNICGNALLLMFVVTSAYALLNLYSIINLWIPC